MRDDPSLPATQATQPRRKLGPTWLPRAQQAQFRKNLLELEGHRCFYCGATNKPLQAHHETRTTGHMACQSCHNKLTQANQFNGNPPPAA